MLERDCGIVNTRSRALPFADMRLRRWRKRPPQRGGAYQPRVQPWGWGSRNRCVLKERRIGVARARIRHPTKCCVPSVKEVKTASSKWLKTQTPALSAFCWQQGYGAFSIGMSQKEALL